MAACPAVVVASRGAEPPETWLRFFAESAVENAGFDHGDMPGDVWLMVWNMLNMFPFSWE